jgi:hypothetical protein
LKAYYLLKLVNLIHLWRIYKWFGLVDKC